ncbi:MAG: hypothetical protein V2B20_25405 [Pseudomonadota bacterium]
MEEFFGWIVASILGFLWSAVVCIILYPLGKTGAFVRKGKDTNKVHLIVLPAIGWLVAYLLAFRLLPIKVFLCSLLLLIPPIFGYFGYILVPKYKVHDD